jgi:CheY-like chemotaxis protein
MSKKKILYVEDNNVNRFILKRLASADYDVDAVETAKECFDLAKKNVYDILLIDLNLDDPEVDGFGVLKELKTYPNLSNAKFVAHTNYFGEDWSEKCLNAGFHYYYPKPFDLEVFNSLLDNEQNALK